jgi:hypothetical protein
LVYFAGKINGICSFIANADEFATFRHWLFPQFQYPGTFSTNDFAAQSNLSVTMGKNPIFAILWLLLLFFIAWPVAGFCAGIWILLQVRLMMSHSKKKKSIDDNRRALSLISCIRSILSCLQMLTPLLFSYYFFTIERLLR